MITPMHLSANPRLVKEADTLAEAGYDVHVFACQYMDWPLEGDKAILQRAKWRATLLCWKADRHPYLFWKSRIRQHACRHLLRWFRERSFSGWMEKLALRAYDRVIPELLGLVLQHPANLYIAHNLQALPIAVIAAKKYGAKVGFDAEDFHAGMRRFGTPLSVDDVITEYLERRYLPECDYITAASPGIAEAYAAKYEIPRPVPILNVFPLSYRPQKLRPSDADSPLTLYWFSQTIGADRGLEDVVRAMGLLQGCRIELHLRGNWQPGYRDQLIRFAISCGVRPEQIVSHEPASSDEMVRLASQFDVGLAVEPGRDRNNQITISNKLFTYLLAGNAVVATATDGQWLILQRIKRAGFCYEPGDVDALAYGLKRWYEDRDALQKAREQAWDWGTREYNWDLEKGKFLQAIEAVLQVTERRDL